jgi:hypothetical protein
MNKQKGNIRNHHSILLQKLRKIMKGLSQNGVFILEGTTCSDPKHSDHCWAHYAPLILLGHFTEPLCNAKAQPS